MSAAIDRMRDARWEVREPLLLQLESMAIQGEIAREARDNCAAVYRAEMEAQRQLDAAGRGLDAGRVEEALAGLEDAQEKLTAARNGIYLCKQMVVRLNASIR